MVCHQYDTTHICFLESCETCKVFTLSVNKWGAIACPVQPEYNFKLYYYHTGCISFNICTDFYILCPPAFGVLQEGGLKLTSKMLHRSVEEVIRNACNTLLLSRAVNELEKPVPTS